jgi:hypothetical protein
MSINSANSINIDTIGPAIKRSEKDSKLDIRLTIGAISVVILVLVGGYSLLYSGTVMRVLQSDSILEQQTIPTPTPLAQQPIVMSVMDDVFTGTVGLATPAPVERVVVSAPEVQALPDIAATVAAVMDERVVSSSAVDAPTVIKEFIEVPVQVVQVITETVFVVPTPTPVMLPGIVRLCIYVEGVTGVYIAGLGVAGNACYDYPVNSPVNDFSVTVTR